MPRRIVLSSVGLLASVALVTAVAQAQTTSSSPAAQPAAAKPAAQAAPKPVTPKAAPKAPAKPAPVQSVVSEEVSPRVLDPSLNDTLRAVRKSGVLRACVALSAPWVMSDGEQALTGYSVDIANQLADDLNVDAHFVLSAIPDMIDRLHRGECDIIPGGFGASPQRALFAHFSTPTMVRNVWVVGRKDTMGTWGKEGALMAPDVSIGVIGGTPDHDVALRLNPKAKIEPFDESEDLTKALTEGKVVAAIVSSPLAEYLVQQSSQSFATLDKPLWTLREGIAVRRGDLEFLAYLNTWVQARMDDRWLENESKKWFEAVDRAAAKTQ